MQNIILTRRRLLKGLTAGSMLLSLPSLSEALPPCLGSGKQIINWSSGMKPLYCAAYIDPTNPSMQGQDQYIAKFPIAVVPQDTLPPYLVWKNGLKTLNPDLKLLAYMGASEESMVSGPGFDLIHQLAPNSWLTVNGKPVTVPVGGTPGFTVGRVYDPRDPVWQNAFILACAAVLNSYPYSGIFLDQCYIYGKPPMTSTDINSMQVALNATLLKLRASFPNKIIIANSSITWDGVNGEMNEGRPADLPAEAAAYPGHASPRMELFYYSMTSPTDTVNAVQMFNLALQNKAFFGTSYSAQVINWYPFFDDILQGYTIV